MTRRRVAYLAPPTVKKKKELKASLNAHNSTESGQCHFKQHYVFVLKQNNTSLQIYIKIKNNTKAHYFSNRKKNEKKANYKQKRYSRRENTEKIKDETIIKSIC